MTPVSIIDALSATNSRTEKEQILLNAFMSGHRDFFVGARLALDPLISFGIAKAALIEEDDGEPGTLSFAEFITLTQRLRRRELTGHAARDAIIDAASRCHVPTWNTFYRRVLLKDLKIGVEEKTINKILDRVSDAFPESRDLMIPLFGCQLAHDGAKPEHAKKIKGRRMLDVKLDGVRLITVLDKDAGTVTQFTRNGKINENFQFIRDCLTLLMDELPGSIVLDGEIVAGTFQELMTQVNRRDDIDTSEVKLAVFDMIPLDEFRKGRCDRPQSARHAALSQLQTSGILSTHCGKSVYVIPKVTVDLDTPEGQTTFGEFNKEAIEAGYEGIMVKDPDAAYEGKRSAGWLKIKPVMSVDLAVAECLEGEGKYEGMLGAIVCEGEDDGRFIRVNVGTGLTDEQRATFWKNRDALIGQIIEVKADAVTKSADGDSYSLRFPRFEKFRSLDGTPGVKD